MEIKETGFEGLYEIIPRVFPDDRGFFLETYRENMLKGAGLCTHFVQDNQSFSHKNVIRGLHLQLPPHEQIKLVRVVHGKALDVAVDLRPDSNTFGQHYSMVLEADRGNMFYIPAGFAHGFAALEDTVLLYKCSTYYHKPSEDGILWNDPDLKIDWKVSDAKVSARDLGNPSFKEFLAKYESIN